MVNNKGIRKVVLNVPVDKDKEIQTTYLINCVWESFNDIKKYNVKFNIQHIYSRQIIMFSGKIINDLNHKFQSLHIKINNLVRTY